MSAVSPLSILLSSSTSARLIARRPTFSAETTSKPSLASSCEIASESFTAFCSAGTFS